jgi:hypothetical protein
MDYQARIEELRTSAKQLTTLPRRRFNSFAEESLMDEIQIIFTEIDRLESLQNQKFSVNL